MKIHLDSPAEDIRIEIIPLMDVIFCILTFFILGAVGLTRQQAINMDLPKASTSKPQMREMLVVSLFPGGRTFVNQDPVTRDQLEDTLRTYHQAKPEGLMVLSASKASSYNEVVEILDLLRKIGGDRVALATLPGESNQQPNPIPTFPVNPTAPGVPLPPTNIPNPGISPLPNNIPNNLPNSSGIPNPANPSDQLPLPTNIPNNPSISNPLNSPVPNPLPPPTNPLPQQPIPNNTSPTIPTAPASPTTVNPGASPNSKNPR